MGMAGVVRSEERSWVESGIVDENINLNQFQQQFIISIRSKPLHLNWAYRYKVMSSHIIPMLLNPPYSPPTLSF